MSDSVISGFPFINLSISVFVILLRRSDVKHSSIKSYILSGNNCRDCLQSPFSHKILRKYLSGRLRITNFLSGFFRLRFSNSAQVIFIAFTMASLQNCRKFVAPVNRMSDRSGRSYNGGAVGEGGESGTLKE